jgi:hypothetical protein
MSISLMFLIKSKVFYNKVKSKRMVTIKKYLIKTLSVISAQMLCQYKFPLYKAIIHSGHSFCMIYQSV